MREEMIYELNQEVKRVLQMLEEVSGGLSRTSNCAEETVCAPCFSSEEKRKLNAVSEEVHDVRNKVRKLQAELDEALSIIRRIEP